MASTARVRREPLAGGGWAWRKTFGPTQRAAARSLLRIFAGWRHLPALAAPAAQSAEQACATEYSMIGRLAALGARVPAILERGERELVLEDLGPTLSSGPCSRRRPRSAMPPCARGSGRSPPCMPLEGMPARPLPVTSPGTASGWASSILRKIPAR